MDIILENYLNTS